MAIRSAEALAGAVRRHPVRAWLACLWLALGAVLTLQRIAVAARTGGTMPPLYGAAVGFAAAASAVLTAAAAVASARAFPLQRAHGARNLALSFLCGGVAIVVLVSAEVWTRRALGDVVMPAYAMIRAGIPSRLGLYVNLLAVGHALGYHRDLRERERAAARLEGEVARSRLALMHARMQPALLYGMLDAVADLVRSDHEAAGRALTRMGEYLRGTLHRAGAGSAPAAEQAAVLRAYAEMLRPAHGAPAEVVVDPAARDLPIPHLLLESLTDVVARPGSGARLLRARIAVRRNGLRLRLAGTSPIGAAAAALGPVRGRVRALYGAGAEVRAHACGEGGSAVLAHLPLSAGEGSHA
jgi:hypothetical protein